MVSSLAAAAAKMTLTPSPKTPQKDDAGRVKQSNFKHEKKAQPYKKNNKKETEVSGGTGMEMGPRSSLAQYNNERQRTPAKNGDTDKKNRNINVNSRKKNTANKPKVPSTTEPVKFEFYLNSSDDDSPGPRHIDKNRQGRDKDWISNGSKSHQKHDKSHNRGNNSDNRQHDAHNSDHNAVRRNNVSKQERGGRFNNSNDNNGRVIDVNVSRRLIGHALGKRIPVNEQRTNKYDDGPRKNQNQSQQKKSSLAQHKSTPSSQFSNNKKTVKKIKTKSPLRQEPESKQEEGPKLIPSSQLNGPIEKCEMKRWADDDDEDDY